MSPRWVQVATTDEIEGERPRAIEVAGVSLALLRLDSQAVAVLDRCPHMTFPLSEGFVRGGRLVCALHHWEFDPLSPDERVPPELRCTVVATKEEDGRVFVDLEDLP